ncbi:unnamed protein product [Brassica oleracea]
MEKFISREIEESESITGVVFFHIRVNQVSTCLDSLCIPATAARALKGTTDLKGDRTLTAAFGRRLLTRRCTVPTYTLRLKLSTLVFGYNPNRNPN